MSLGVSIHGLKRGDGWIISLAVAALRHHCEQDGEETVLAVLTILAGGEKGEGEDDHQNFFSALLLVRCRPQQRTLYDPTGTPSCHLEKAIL